MGERAASAKLSLASICRAGAISDLDSASGETSASLN
jgi:hypothetical protein